MITKPIPPVLRSQLNRLAHTLAGKYELEVKHRLQDEFRALLTADTPMLALEQRIEEIEQRPIKFVSNRKVSPSTAGDVEIGC